MRYVVIAALAILLPVVLADRYGAARWRARTLELISRIESARTAPIPALYDARRELSGLPAPVQRYFRATLRDGQPMIAAVSLEHAGTFNLSEDGERWRPFISQQRVIVREPGFVWDGRVSMLPGIDVHVHDAYVAGEGVLHPSVMGLISLAQMRGTGEIATGELMRYLAEAAWYPTALLPSQGVRWNAIDERSARATIDVRATSVTLLFTFGDDGAIEAVRADARGRTVGGRTVPTPWEGRWTNYSLREGMRVPLHGEVAWLTPQGRKAYWRGSVTSLVYEFTQADAGDGARVSPSPRELSASPPQSPRPAAP